MLMQTNIVLAVASDPDNPITAAITSAIDNLNPSPEPSSTPSPTLTPTPAPTSTPAPHPETNFVAVNLAPAAESPTPNGSGTLTVTLTDRTPSGSVGVIERGYVSGIFQNLIPNSLYTIWFVQHNFLGYDPVRSNEMRSDENGNIAFFTADFNFYHRVDQQIKMVNIALRSHDLSSQSESCSKYTPCLYSNITFPAVTSAPTPQPTATPSATPQATASATPSAQPISSPIIDNPSNCLDLWIFEICLPNLTPPISTPVVNPTPAPSTSPTPVPTPTATPEPAATPVINSIFPNPATQGTRVTLTGSNFSYSSKLYIGGNWPAPQSFYSVSENGKSLTFVLTTELNYQAGEILPVFVQNDTQKSNTVNLVVAPSIVDPIPDLKENQKLIAASLTLDKEHPEAVIVSTNFNADINIPTSVANPTLKFANLYTNQNKAAAYFNNIININADTLAGTIKVQIPSLTTISGPLSWNGIINAPQVKDNSTAKPDADQGKIAVVAKVIEVGADDIPLTFNNAVRLLIPGQAGKLAGYQRGSTFSRITQSCAADSKEAGDNLSAEGDCTISAGGDLVIWTKHFTKFVTYSQTAIQSQGNSSGSSSNASNPSSPSNPPVCTDVKPASAPKLISAKATGRNEVTLSWTKAADPVTYYLVAYGTKSGQLEYGNPNIGGKDTSSYVVKRLNNNQTYYFKVRAGNNCMPGEFSNELAVKASGGYITAPAKGFKAGVLSAKNPEDLVSKNELKYKPITQVQPGRAVSQPVTIVTKIISLFAHLLNRQ